MDLSIIVPVYNEEDNIYDLVKNVTYVLSCNYEIIFIDDCSTDSSAKIIEQIIKSSTANIKLIMNDVNLGVSLSRNKGIEVSEGKYLIFLDADDNLSINFEGIMDKYLSLYKNIDLIRFNHSQTSTNFENEIHVQSLDDIPIEIIKSYYLHSASTQIIRKDFIKKGFRSDLSFGEDMFFSFGLLRDSSNALFLSDVLYIYNYVGDSVSNIVDTKTINTRIDSIHIAYNDILAVVSNTLQEVYTLKYLREISMQLLKLSIVSKKDYNDQVLKAHEKVKFFVISENKDPYLYFSRKLIEGDYFRMRFISILYSLMFKIKRKKLKK